MRRALWWSLWIGMAVATAAHADIRILMKARGYSSPYQSRGKIEQGSVTSTDAVSDQPSVSTGCTFPATMPCTFGG